MAGQSLTAKKKALFLKQLALTGNVTKSAASADWRRQTAHEHRKNDPKFAEAWENAEQEYADHLEREADRRAVEGFDEPRFYEGQVCGHVRKYSDTLLIFRLKALRPSKYRDNQAVTVSGPYGGPIEIADARQILLNRINSIAARVGQAGHDGEKATGAPEP